MSEFNSTPAKDVVVAFGRYRFIAIATGVVLAFLTVVAIPYKYIFNGTGEWTAYAWMAHGWFYIVYFLLTLDLGLRAKWSPGKLLVIVLAGTVPFMSFWSERKLRRELGL
jgi:integral membrane protein